MHSVLFSLHHIAVHSYGACLAIAIILCYFLMVRLSRSSGYTSEFISNLLTVLIISGLAGARLFYVVEHWDLYSPNPMSVFKVWEGGLMFYGGLLLSCATLLIFIRLQKKPLADVLDIVATAVPLGHAIGRVGCFLNGCCYGRLSDSSLAVTYPHGSIPWAEQLAQYLPIAPEYGQLIAEGARSLPVLPTQLIEASLNFVVFLLLLLLFRHRQRPGTQVAAYMVMYAIVRFVVEYTRADERLHIGPLSISQVISLALFIGGIGLFAWLSRKPRHASA